MLPLVASGRIRDVPIGCADAGSGRISSCSRTRRAQLLRIRFHATRGATMSLYDDPRFVRFRKDRESILVKVFFVLSLPLELLTLLGGSGFLERVEISANSYRWLVLHLGIPLVAAAWLWAGSIRLRVSRMAGNFMALALFLLVLHEGWRLYGERHPGRTPLALAAEDSAMEGAPRR